MLTMNSPCLTMVPPPLCMNSSLSAPTTSGGLSYEGHVSMMTSGLEETMKAAMELERNLKRERSPIPVQSQVNTTESINEEEQFHQQRVHEETTPTVNDVSETHETEEKEESSPRSTNPTTEMLAENDIDSKEESSGFEELEVEPEVFNEMNPIQRLQMVFGLEAIANQEISFPQQGPLKCTHCDYICVQENQLHLHLQEVHGRHSQSQVKSEDTQATRMPRTKAHGKTKVYKCKQCPFLSVRKDEFWVHARLHIPKEKQLECPQCPFVTEYKHHLEYHLRNHNGTKPFHCSKCNYTCVNKSMLNSHMKSHSNIYQYRCTDCTYVSKYCHSLKVHLRKYQHKPATVLNADGTPNPNPIIDVYGTRRGPKTKKVPVGNSSQNHSPALPQPILLPFPPGAPHHTFPPYLLNTYPPTHHLSQSIMNSQMQQLYQQHFAALVQPPPMQVQAQMQAQVQAQVQTQAPLDLRKEQVEDAGTVANVIASGSQQQQQQQRQQQRNRRKGQAFKLERITQRLQAEQEPKENNTLMDHTETPQLPLMSPPAMKEESNSSEENPDKERKDPPSSPKNRASSISPPVAPSTAGEHGVQDLCCPYCYITFKDHVLYTMHMGYHGFNDPFCCNRCGVRTKDRFAFFVHMARASHM